MSWIGKKKIAFIPVHSPSGDSLPPNWREQVLRRIYNDPVQPGIDRSLRSYISTTSYGMADLEGHLLPMVEIEKPDAPVDALAGQDEKSLRSQAFDAAAVVMLDDVGAGNVQPAGFWARFLISEGVGKWAMELLDALSGCRDLYLYPELDGSFDNMPCIVGTHPSAYMKQKLGWLDPSSIIKHVGRTAEYRLHTLGLAQPAPAGMATAVQVGENANLLMVEARQKVDQFDYDLPSEGVIIYEVHNPEKRRSPNVTRPSIQLRTPGALKPGQRFISSPGIAVQVNSAIEKGFSITIEHNNIRVYDRSGEVGAPDGLPGMVPTACVIPALGVYSITYCDYSPDDPLRHHLQSLWRDSQGVPHWTDLTTNANGVMSIYGAKNPIAYVDTTRNNEVILWNSNRGGLSIREDVHSNYYSRSPVRFDHDNLTRAAGLVGKAYTGYVKQAVGYYNPSNDTNHVFFVGNEEWEYDVHELWWVGVSRVRYGGNLSNAAYPRRPPTPVSLGSAFVGSQGYNIVLLRGYGGYIDEPGNIYSLFWKADTDVGSKLLSGIDGTAPWAQTYPFRPYYSPDPVGYYTAHDDRHQVVYRGNDDHLYEIHWVGLNRPQGWDITAHSNAPAAKYNVCNFSAYYSAGTNTKHVIYVTEDHHLHDIAWIPAQTPEHFDLTTLTDPPLPPAYGRPAAFTIEGPNTQHVAYRGGDNHIYEVIW